MALSEADRERLRQDNIRARENAQTAPAGISSAQASLALQQARKLRAHAILEDEQQYDDEVVSAYVHVARAESIMNADRRYLVVTTKCGRVYEILLDDDKAQWVEIAPPVPRTDARRSFNNIVRATANVADVSEEQ